MGKRVLVLLALAAMCCAAGAHAVTVTVPGAWTYAGFWADTGLDVSAGSALHVTASGTLRAADNPTCGPDGYPSNVVSWFDQWLNPNNLGDGRLDPAAGGAPPITDHYYALIGYIGPSALPPSLYGNVDYAYRVYYISRMMLLGSDVTVTAPASGRLWLGINTDAYAGNLSNDVGSIVATVELVPEPSSLLALLSGIAGLGGVVRRRKR